MTPHNRAKKGEIAKTVLMPGDPMRAKMIAEEFLTDYRLVNDIRGMYAYTGYYKGKRVTIMASGMGIPSMAVYSYELYDIYDVDNIIRIGSAGAYTTDLNLYDLVLVEGSYSRSSYANVLDGYDKDMVWASEELNKDILSKAKSLGKDIVLGNVNCSEIFYGDKTDYRSLYDTKGCIAIEMESFSLFYNAKKLNKKASCLLTISDSVVTGEETSPIERQNSFKDMALIALETAISL